MVILHGKVALDVLRRIEHASRSNRRSTIWCPAVLGKTLSEYVQNVCERKIEAWTEDGQQRRKPRKRNAESDENRRPEGQLLVYAR